jgi:hypothetical protein
VNSFVLSTPFHYVVHNETMVGVDELKQHYQDCGRIFSELQEATGHAYLDIEKQMFVEELQRHEVDDLVDGQHFKTAFRTSERSVDPRPLAAALRSAVAAEPRINFLGSARVLAVDSDAPSRLTVVWRAADGDRRRESYDHVANTLWHGRLEVDAGIGVAYERPWLYRYKFGNRVFVRLHSEALPSLTCVLAPSATSSTSVIMACTSRGTRLG